MRTSQPSPVCLLPSPELFWIIPFTVRLLSRGRSGIFRDMMKRWNDKRMTLFVEENIQVSNGVDTICRIFGWMLLDSLCKKDKKT